MYNPRKMLQKCISIIKKLFSLQVISLNRTLFLIFLSFFVILFEALSIVSLMPLIQFIQYGLDVNVFIEKTQYGEKLFQFFNFIGVSFNLINLSVILAFLVIIRQIFSYVAVVEKHKTSLQIAKDLSVRCFSKIMKSTAQYIRTINTGQFSVITEYECLQVATIYNYILAFIGLSVQVTAYILTMMLVSISSTIGASSIILIIVFLMMRYVYKANLEGKTIVNIRKRFYNSLSEEFSLWRLIKFHSMNRDILRNILPIAEHYATSQLKLTKYRERSKLFIILIAIFSISILLFISIELLKIDYAQLTFFGIIFIRLMPLGQQINSNLAHIAQVEPSLETVKNTIDEAIRNEEDIFSGKKLNEINKFIIFKSVNFNYPNTSYKALENINIKIPIEKITAIVGRSGAGKSTLIDMLPRIIKPSSGSIYIDDCLIDEYSIESLRKKISYISQDSTLFEGTIRDNICYFKSDVSDKDFQEALILSDVASFINHFEEQENYNIGEKGKNLSGGQKQRLILARAFLSDASILILDEATSALDLESERHIKAALSNLIKIKKMTIIIISHRKEIIQEADYIIHMQDGNISEISNKSNRYKDI